MCCGTTRRLHTASHRFVGNGDSHRSHWIRPTPTSVENIALQYAVGSFIPLPFADASRRVLPSILYYDYGASFARTRFQFSRQIIPRSTPGLIL